ncbi:non-canonical purine NTP pyrophosphatase, rdgB/HAM1 family [Desulfitobacterium dichloroeliminans LMG P-21439]|uniref:dITP/XTP pyrophosphatase n=1 Tax=Desulfitobacterium dichloroeliminans (strain LMG P-21439 / DCA1) TaxID=871963 RepID=L0FC44_DESDL|nr:XTP/dITP diphosphatase [Desulfitobacterium dichloroeliminans]AGA70498.1 non-canonical purine NTP pyrophosphatase, rdgB/HAM1 family [Desulfitobacterium dichloroeliminans LMG P-21439]
MKVLLATKNLGKVKELQDLLSGEDIEVISLEDIEDWEEVEETGVTFAENAAMKARIAAERTGLISLADDSGLEVDALDGAPGVYSARYAGESKDDDKNNDKLLNELEGVPEAQRTGRFRCALVIATPAGEEFLTEGAVEGRILNERRGKEGFGYDPLFYLPDFGRTMAQLNLCQKNKISHRAQALLNAIPVLKEIAQRHTTRKENF